MFGELYDNLEESFVLPTMGISYPDVRKYAVVETIAKEHVNLTHRRENIARRKIAETIKFVGKHFLPGNGIRGLVRASSNKLSLAVKSLV